MDDEDLWLRENPLRGRLGRARDYSGAQAKVPVETFIEAMENSGTMRQGLQAAERRRERRVAPCMD